MDYELRKEMVVEKSERVSEGKTMASDRYESGLRQGLGERGDTGVLRFRQGGYMVGAKMMVFWALNRATSQRSGATSRRSKATSRRSKERLQPTSRRSKATSRRSKATSRRSREWLK